MLLFFSKIDFLSCMDGKRGWVSLEDLLMSSFSEIFQSAMFCIQGAKNH